MTQYELSNIKEKYCSNTFTGIDLANRLSIVAANKVEARRLEESVTFTELYNNSNMQKYQVRELAIELSDAYSVIRYLLNKLEEKEVAE